MYELLTNGAADLARYTTLLDVRKIIRDPLSGPVNGTNTIFLGNYPSALLSGSTAVFIGTTPQSNYQFIADNVQFTLSSAPAAGSAQVYGNYTYSSLAPDVITKILFLGFDEMESRWARGFRLSSSSSTYIAASDTDSSVYVVSSSDVSDPTSSGIYFSTSRTQIAFYMKCSQFAYYSQKMYDEAATGMSYREAGGMAVDTTKRASNINMLISRIDKELTKMMMAAQADWLQNSGGFADAILSSKSGDYIRNFQWQDGIATENGTYRGNMDSEL